MKRLQKYYTNHYEATTKPLQNNCKTTTHHYKTTFSSNINAALNIFIIMLLLIYKIYMLEKSVNQT